MVQMVKPVSMARSNILALGNFLVIKGTFKFQKQVVGGSAKLIGSY